MYLLKEKFRILKHKLVEKKENLLHFLVSMVLSMGLLTSYHFLGSRLTTALWLVTAILLVLLLSIIMVIAGFAVLKALFYVAAELSLLIFLAQSYCDVPNYPVSGEQALKSLLFIGISYILIKFFLSLYKALKKNYKVVKNEGWSNEKVATVVLVLVFTVLFIYEIYLVTAPIVQNLCVFK